MSTDNTALMLECPACAATLPVAAFPACRELREALAGVHRRRGVVDPHVDRPRVACNACQDILKRPASSDYQRLIHAAWLRGEDLSK